jgi:kynureninase
MHGSEITDSTSSAIVGNVSEQFKELLQARLAVEGTPEQMNESWMKVNVFPLFSQVLARNHEEIYFANHSLGRAPDATLDQILEGTRLWYSQLDDAWGPWMDAMSQFRKKTASLLNLPADQSHAIVPKASVGQALRAVLGSFPIEKYPLKVMTSMSEFDSVDIILKQWNDRKRIQVQWLGKQTDQAPSYEEIVNALQTAETTPHLLVISQTFFATGQILKNVKELVEIAHQVGTKVFLDCYHSYGVIPIDMLDLNVDFASAGSYKYTRGGPGCCWLYVSPQIVKDPEIAPIDIGWFAKKNPFNYARPVDGCADLGEGGEAWLESTFSPLPFYQSLAGLDFVAAMGISNLRRYSLAQKKFFSELLKSKNIAHFGMDEEYGAFLTVHHPEPPLLAKKLKAKGLNSDARAAGVRFCPDVLNTEEEMLRAVEIIEEVLTSF